MSLSGLSWQALIIFGSILTSIGQALNKYQVNRAASLLVMVFKYLSAVAITSTIWGLSRVGLPKQWWLFVVYGVATGAAVTLNTKAQRFSLSKTILSVPAANVLGLVLAAVLLNEWALFDLTTRSGKQLLAALLLVPGLFYWFHEKGKQTKQWSSLIWFTVIFMGFTRVVSKYFLGRIEPIQLIFLQYWGSLVAVMMGSRIKKHKLNVEKNFALLGLIQGVFTSSGTLMYYMALKQATVTQTVLLRTPLILFLATMVGFFGFKELRQMTGKKWLGVITAIIMTGLVITANY